jgi:hypothetical protein
MLVLDSGPGPARPETLVRYRPYGPVARILFTIMFAALAAGFLVFAFYVSSDVSVDASHQTGVCVVTRTFPLLGPRRESYPLAAILGTRMHSRVTKNGVIAYAVSLSTADGDRNISWQSAPRGRQAQKRALDAFLADPGAPPLHLGYDQGSPVAFLLGLVPLVWLWVLWTLWQQATVRFEWWRRAVVLERRRWPLPLWTRAFQTGEIAGTQVDQRGYRGRRSYRIALTLGSGEAVPLLGVWSGSAAAPQAAAAELEAALRRR